MSVAHELFRDEPTVDERPRRRRDPLNATTFIPSRVERRALPFRRRRGGRRVGEAPEPHSPWAGRDAGAATVHGSTRSPSPAELRAARRTVIAGAVVTAVIGLVAASLATWT
jgi:hypothetical protein